MRKILLQVILIGIVTVCQGYDWVAKDTRALKADMIEFAQQFADSAAGSKAEGIIRGLIQRQKADTGTCGWMEDVLESVWKIEKIYPPTMKNDNIRKMALQLLDYPLHVDDKGTEKSRIAKATDEEKAAFRQFCIRYKERARDIFLKWLDRPRPGKGELELFKLYNMGFVLRTCDHTLAIDLRWEGSDEDADKIASVSDLFILTHAHADHFSENILSAFSKAGKPMYLPQDLCPEYQNKIVAKGDCEGTFNGISIRSIMGAQGDTPCNIFMIDMDGWKIVDNGDNSMMDKEFGITQYGPYDIVIAAIWNEVTNILSAAGGSPVLIPAHENELGHGVDHRESYHETFSRKDRLGNPDFNYPPYILMDIGECYTFKK